MGFEESGRDESEVILRALSGKPGYTELGRLENTGGMVEVLVVSLMDILSLQGLCRWLLGR